MLPFQMSVLGYTAPSVSATNHLFNIVGIPGGVLRYYKERRMVWPLTLLIVSGSVPGVFIGALVRVSFLPDPRHFKLFAAAVLLYMGARMAHDLLRGGGGRAGVEPSAGEGGAAEPRSSSVSGGASDVGLGRGAGDDCVGRVAVDGGAGPCAGGVERGADTGASPCGDRGHPAVKILCFTPKRFAYTFSGVEYDVPFWTVLALSFIVGIVGGIYGIGGGSIVAPFLVAFIRLPVHTVAGAALMGTFVSSVAGVAFYQAIAPFHPGLSVAPDWLLGAMFGIGGIAGMYMGATCQKYIPARAIKWMLSAIVVFMALKYGAAVFGL